MIVVLNQGPPKSQSCVATTQLLFLRLQGIWKLMELIIAGKENLQLAREFPLSLRITYPNDGHPGRQMGGGAKV